MSKLSNTLMDVPHDLQEHAHLRPSRDILDQSHGLGHIVILECPHCREGYGFHWAGAESAFRKHLLGCGRSTTPQAPIKVWGPNKLQKIKP